MATIIGRNAKVAISDDDITYTDIGKVTSASLSISNDLAEETNNDSGGYKETKYADSQGTLDLAFKFDSANVGQSALVAANTGKLTKYFRFRPEESAGELEWTFQGNISDLSFETETGAVEDGSLTIESTGTITQTTQP